MWTQFYLPWPSFCKHDGKTKEFERLIVRVEHNLASWKSKVLSYAGRSVLAKAVAQTLPTYVLQTFDITMSICRKIDGTIRDFWWGFDKEKKRHLYMKSWQSICAPKTAGGLGFRGIKEVNEAFHTKLAWQLCT